MCASLAIWTSSCQVVAMVVDMVYTYDISLLVVLSLLFLILYPVYISIYLTTTLYLLPTQNITQQITDEKKLSKTSEDDLHDKFFADAKKAKKYVNLIHFEPFADTADAVTAAAACIDGKVSKSLKSFLKKQLKKSSDGDSLAILDKSMVSGIKEAVPNLNCSLACDAKTNELFRGIRCYLDELMEGKDSEEKDEGPTVSEGDLTAMRLGLSHSLSRYKLKFSSDKVDTMVIQAIGLLDELDKEINTYAMRVKEWYGWHFPGK